MQKHASCARFRPRRAILLVVAVVLLASTGSLMASESPRWALRVYGLSFSPTGDEVTVLRSISPGIDERTTHTAADDGTGFGLSLEYRWTTRISLELGASFVDFDNDFQLETGGVLLTDSDEMSVEIFSFGADWHFTPERRADLRLGVFVAETSFSDVIFLTEAGRNEKLAFDDDYGFGAKLGVDVPFRSGSRWFLNADVRYLITILESEVAGQDLDLDPLLVSAGVGFRF